MKRTSSAAPESSLPPALSRSTESVSKRVRIGPGVMPGEVGGASRHVSTRRNILDSPTARQRVAQQEPEEVQVRFVALTEHRRGITWDAVEPRADTTLLGVSGPFVHRQLSRKPNAPGIRGASGATTFDQIFLKVPVRKSKVIFRIPKPHKYIIRLLYLAKSCIFFNI